MSATWVRPVTVSFPPTGLYGLGTVRGGPFADDQTFDVTTLFGPNSSYSSGFHGGLDVAAPSGTPLFALGEGVAYRGYDPTGAGNWVVVYSLEGYYYEYLHLREPARFGNAQYVQQGDVLGYVGSTGQSTGPHLHLNIGKGSNLDPLAFMEGARDVGEPAPDPYPVPLAYFNWRGKGEHPWDNDWELSWVTAQPNVYVEFVREDAYKGRLRIQDWAS